MDKSTDVGGGITSSFATSGTCGGGGWTYRYFGNLTGTAKITFTDAIGPQVPHYQLRVIFWMILIDVWQPNDLINVTFNGNMSANTQQKNALTT